MIRLHQVQKSFGRRTVLNNISLTVAPGEVLVIDGPSGCGKTTLLDIIAGLTRPDAGRVDVTVDPVGYAFQDDRLIPWRTTRENLLFALRARQTEGEAAQAADRWLERLELAEAASQFPGQLSGGMRRRTGIARALAVRPPLVLLDEPLAFLDRDRIHSLVRLLAEVRDEWRPAIVIVSHQLEELAPLGPQVLKMAARSV